MKKIKMLLTVIVMAVFMGSLTVFAAGQTSSMAIGSLKLTDEQVVALGGLLDEFNKKQFEILTQIENKLLELRQEIKKKDRFETKLKEIDSVWKANKLAKELSSLYGQLLKTKVEYLLKAKNVLTKEQKVQLISGLEFEDDYFEDDFPEIIELDLMIISLDLTIEQIKKILKYETDMKIKALKIALEIEYNLIDLKTELNNAETDPQNIDRIILSITDHGTKLLDNRVNYFLKSKDVLTVPQKKRLIHAIMML
ncbi:MAG: hypothetical protein E3J56_16100 [Candidatus Aminicenantes bacterium]|nr:MAG: hypothetical protein E3J56_16100 [Candidatus Aminicenantes bacterium]